MQNIEFSDIEITGGYWKTRQDINSEVTLKSVYERPKETDNLYYEAYDDFEEIPLTLIPYYAFANRGETEMQVWLLRKN